MTTQIQVRRDVSANWTSTNPTLASGEVGYETNTKKMKVGDGATAWVSLPYFPTDFNWVAASIASPYTDGSGLGYSSPGYRKNGNLVYFRGAFLPNTASSNTTAFTLGSGYRPIASISQPVVGLAVTPGIIICNITTAGVVSFVWPSTTPIAIVIEGVSFSVD